MEPLPTSQSVLDLEVDNIVFGNQTQRLSTAHTTAQVAGHPNTQTTAALQNSMHTNISSTVGAASMQDATPHGSSTSIEIDGSHSAYASDADDEEDEEEEEDDDEEEEEDTDMTAPDTHHYSEHANESEASDTEPDDTHQVCTICARRLAVIGLTPCSHFFCTSCVLNVWWSGVHHPHHWPLILPCPVCRHLVEDVIDEGGVVIDLLWWVLLVSQRAQQRATAENADMIVDAHAQALVRNIVEFNALMN